MLTKPAITAEIHSALRAPWLRTVTMIIRTYMLRPATETHFVPVTKIPAADGAGAGAGAGATATAAGNDVDGASGGIVDGETGRGLAVHVDGAGIV